MKSFLGAFLPAITFCIPAFLLFLLFTYRDYKFKRFGRRNPLTRDLLRSPGDGLREKIDELSLEIDAYLTFLLITPLLLYASFVSQAYFSNKTNLLNAVVLTSSGLVIILYLLVKMYSMINLRIKYRVGLDAELSAGQELNQLMRQGFWVFHDFPAEKFNIDHIVIGDSGVYAIETKGRSKPRQLSGPPEVIYDGNSLKFPDWEERKALEQTQRQAKWLEEWLAKAVGEPIRVKPVLALPGWYVNNQSSGGIPVINGRNCEAFFALRNSSEALDETLQQRIAYQIEQKCRNVAPKAYKKA